jgi:hypothetical protein
MKKLLLCAAFCVAWIAPAEKASTRPSDKRPDTREPLVHAPRPRIVCTTTGCALRCVHTRILNGTRLDQATSSSSSAFASFKSRVSKPSVNHP